MAAVVLASFKPYGGWAARIPVLTGAVHEARYPLADEASGILMSGLFQPAGQGAAGQRMDMFSTHSQRNGAGRFSLAQAPGSVHGTQWTGDDPGNGNPVYCPINSSQGTPAIYLKWPGRNAPLLFVMQAGIFSSLCYNSLLRCCISSAKQIFFRRRQVW